MSGQWQVRVPIVFCFVLGLAGCEGAIEAEGDGRPGGGKADHADDCGEDRVCLDARQHDVVFTNPVCARHEYSEPVPTVDGEELLHQKPQNVYCAPSDAAAAGARPETPQSRLVDWIDDTRAGDWIVLAALSLSDEVVFDALCATPADVSFIVHRTTALSDRIAGAECGRNKEVLERGDTGGVALAHIKLVAINPDRRGPSDPDGEYARLSFGSGNISAGTHLHHENWHFLEVARDSYFFQSHVCLIDSLIFEPHTAGRGAFRDAMNDCRADIPHPEEDDIKAYFVPVVEDRHAAMDKVMRGIASAEALDLAMHRFTHPDIADAMADRLRADDGFSMRVVADDDLYWLNPLDGDGERVGYNEPFEADIIEDLQAASSGAGDRRIDRFSTGTFQIKYMETRHESRQLHHNKFALFRGMPERDGVLYGAANLSRSGFESNLENIYYAEIPHVVDAFRAQYERFWDGRRLHPDEPAPPRATAPDKMPAFNVQP